MSGAAERRLHSRGYVLLRVPGHPRAVSGSKCVYEHIIVAERALGRPLPERHPVHHVNKNRADNGHGNLVICQDTAYHALLHYRARALRESGHANWLRCSYCGQWDAPENLYQHPRINLSQHRACQRASHAQRREQERARRFERNASSPIDLVPDGFCQCGCGHPTEIATTDDIKNGLTPGQHRPFLRGHNVRLRYRLEGAGHINDPKRADAYRDHAAVLLEMATIEEVLGA